MAKKKKSIDADAQKKLWLEELQNSESVKNYLNRFNESSTKDFLKDYVHKKSIWNTYADLYADSIEKEQLQWINTAFKHLELILQKKLFDAQCLWRAEKISFENIEICEDFKVWEYDVFNCPFIEPVNEQDIDLYARYLLQNNAEALTDEYGDWQNYEEIKEAYNTNNENRNFPEWYDFHNGHTGRGTLMLLPDIRGEKEKFYYDLHFEQQRELNKKDHEEWEKNRDKRPCLHGYDEDTIKYFVSTFENKEEQNLYNDYAFANRHRDEKDTLMDITDALLKADEFVPIESHYDWFEALQLALNRHTCKKIAEALPMALEQYQMNIQMGIAFPAEGKNEHNPLREIWLQNILNGRRLNGDPEDLNF